MHGGREERKAKHKSEEESGMEFARKYTIRELTNYMICMSR